jgi:hypothetical protein
MRSRRCECCGNQAPKGKRLCRKCALKEQRRQAHDREHALRVGSRCLMCQEPSLKEICDKCDQKLRVSSKTKPGQRDMLYPVRSVVAGGLPSLGKRLR